MNEPIPLIDIAGEYRELRTEIDSAIRRVIDGTQFILGSEVAAFEEEFAAYCGTEFAVGVNSGTSALHNGQYFAAGLFGIIRPNHLATPFLEIGLKFGQKFIQIFYGPPFNNVAFALSILQIGNAR